MSTTGCAVPAFSVSTTLAEGTYDIEYLEFEESILNDTAFQTWGRVGSQAASARQSPPRTGMPARNSMFTNGQGSGAVYKQGQYNSTNTNTNNKAGRYVESIGGKKVWGIND